MIRKKKIIKGDSTVSSQPHKSLEEDKTSLMNIVIYLLSPNGASIRALNFGQRTDSGARDV